MKCQILFSKKNIISLSSAESAHSTTSVNAYSVDPDQTLHPAASDLDLHCLPITHLGVSQLKWVSSTPTTKKVKVKETRYTW